MREPICSPLFRIERWERQAALGEEVVPDVNCILTMSWLERIEEGVGLLVSVSRLMLEKGLVARKSAGSILPAELSTRMIFLRDGASSDSSLELAESLIIVSSMGTFERGGLKGRLVSVPIMRWVTPRWFRALMICVAPKDGLRGTSIAPNLNSAYVVVANSRLFPKDTATLSPFVTPKLCRPCASTLLSASSCV